MYLYYSGKTTKVNIKLYPRKKDGLEMTINEINKNAHEIINEWLSQDNPLNTVAEKFLDKNKIYNKKDRQDIIEEASKWANSMIGNPGY